MKVWLVIFEDRHFDTEVEAWTGRQGAELRAWEMMRTLCSHPETIHIEMNEAMFRSGWTLNLRSYDDGPAVRVVETETKA